MANSRSLEWDGRKLLYYSQETPCIPPLLDSVISFQPTARAWQKFEEGLTNIGAFNWRTKYGSERASEGQYLDIWIKFKRTIECSCDLERPPKFEPFLELIQALVKSDQAISRASIELILGGINESL